MTSVRETNLPDLAYRGKVRDTYNWGDGLLLMVATDRISAFDVVLPTVIPEKGAVLCQLSAFWFEKTSHLMPNHFVRLTTAENTQPLSREEARRAMVVRSAERIDIECIVRGYITGSAWAEYRRRGTVSEQSMPSGLREGDRFPQPLFTPTTKADTGHDESMTVRQMEDAIGKDLTRELEEKSVAIYTFSRDLALEKGIIIADTKMEFGFIHGRVALIDELLTPDSSRFWDAEGYKPGRSQPNFDKQFVRDWLNTQGWDHEPPAPELPENVVEKTRQRYLEAFRRLTGRAIA